MLMAEALIIARLEDFTLSRLADMLAESEALGYRFLRVSKNRPNARR
jgi:hypothetical protein